MRRTYTDCGNYGICTNVGGACDACRESQGNDESDFGIWLLSGLACVALYALVMWVLLDWLA